MSPTDPPFLGPLRFQSGVSVPDGDVLAYSAARQQWEPVAAGASSLPSIADFGSTSTPGATVTTIQAALASGKVFYVPDGVYQVNSMITVGAGSGQMYSPSGFDFNPAGPLTGVIFRATTAMQAVFQVNLNGWSAEGIQWDGAGLATSALEIASDQVELLRCGAHAGASQALLSNGKTRATDCIFQQAGVKAGFAADIGGSDGIWTGVQFRRGIAANVKVRGASHNFTGGHWTGIGGATVLTPTTWAAGVATFKCSGQGPWTVGQTVVISGMTPAGYNGTFVIASLVGTTGFTVPIVGDPGGPGTIFGTAAGAGIVTVNNLWVQGNRNQFTGVHFDTGGIGGPFIFLDGGPRNTFSGCVFGADGPGASGPCIGINVSGGNADCNEFIGGNSSCLNSNYTAFIDQVGGPTGTVVQGMAILSSADLWTPGSRPDVFEGNTFGIIPSLTKRLCSNQGTFVASGNGVATVFTIPQATTNLPLAAETANGYTSSAYCSVTPASVAADAAYFATLANGAITITYAVAPPNAANNLTWNWRAAL